MEREQKAVFATRLGQLRNKRKETQEELSEAIGIDRGTVAKYETQKRIPSYEHLVILAKYFNVSTDYLLGRTDIMASDVNVALICEYTGLSENTVKMLISTTSMSLQQSLDLFESTTISESEKEELYDSLGDYPEQLSGCSFIFSDFINMLFNNEELFKTAFYFTEANRTAFNGIDENQDWKETENGDIIISGPMCRELYISQCVKSFEKIVREALGNAQHNPKNE